MVIPRQTPSQFSLGSQSWETAFSTVVTIDFSKHPLILSDCQPIGLSEYLSPEFGPSKSGPTGVSNLFVTSFPLGVSSFSLAGSILTVNLSRTFLGEFVIQGLISY